MKETKSADPVEIRPGQVWADMDPRIKGRTVEVVLVDGEYAAVKTSAGRATKIRLDRFGHSAKRGYRLLSQPECKATLEMDGKTADLDAVVRESERRGNGMLHVLRRDVEHLPVRLTEDELLERGQALAQIEADVRGHEEHSKEVKQGLRAEEARLAAERCRIAGIVRRRSEERPIEVELRADYKARTAVTVRTDTGDPVRQRPLTEEEMQGKLFGEAEQQAQKTHEVRADAHPA